MSAPEFSHSVRVEGIAALPPTLVLQPSEAQRVLLAQRFGLASLDRFVATLAVRQDVRGVHVSGEVVADLQYICRVSQEPFTGRVVEPLNILFLQGLTEAELPSPEDAALSNDPLELMPLAGHEIDLGELAVETFGLGLEPFPRGPAADAAMKQLGILSEEEAKRLASPFAILAEPQRKS